ncbi:serine/threonine/tyrosine-interacting-like protein 2 [Carassius carassius]|uniref:serine/threonine/tyrosine-interacting-like protein 2 n=1 Tax=Carassius carassius TaxID=217509 RepID=UPI00286962E3|nr:serine/threonine/tyrosine-interacting-like protein 2 [Carassius carassius]
MSTEVREVLLEVYLNGAFYCRESYWASDDKDVQLEFEITDAIYDLLGCSASQEIDVQLEFETDDHVSVGHCSPGEMHMELEAEENQNISVCEVKDLQLEMNRNVSVSELKRPALVSEDLRDPAGPSVEDSDVQENSPTESTAGWMFKKISAVFQQLTAIFQTNALNAVGEPEVDLHDTEKSCLPDPSVPKPDPEMNLVDTKQSCIPETGMDLVDSEQSCVPDPSVPDPEPEVDLLDPEISCVPDPSVPELDPEMNLVDTKQSCIPEPEMNLVDIEQSCVPDPSVPDPGPEVDLVDPEESCAPGPSVPEPEPEVTSEHLSLENCIRLNVSKLEDRLRECTLSKTPVTEVWPRVFIGNEETAWDRDKLKEMGITHILNAAAPKKDLKFLLGMASEKDLLGTVNTGSRYYRGMNMTYCGLPSFRHWANISKYFLPAAKFIHKALRNPTSKVLIHCTQGLSHSATLFLAYLMICHDMMVEEAIDHVIKVRCIKPYFGHLKHLAFLNADLVLQRKLKLQGGKTDKKMKKWQVKTK